MEVLSFIHRMSTQASMFDVRMQQPRVVRGVDEPVHAHRIR